MPLSTSVQQSIKLYSSTDREWNEATVQICPEVTSNWISKEIVRQFGLKPWRRKSAQEAHYDGKTLVSTGKVVDLSCPGQSCRHRFHIVEKVPFDILYGAEFVAGAWRE